MTRRRRLSPPARDGRKECMRCGATKTTASFSRDKRRKDGFFPYCMACQSTASQRRQPFDGEPNGHLCRLCLEECRGHPNRRFCSPYCKNRGAAITKKYGLTLEEYRGLLDDCGGRCPICLCKMSRVAIEHNHQTLEVTGICCTRCNVGLLAYSNHDPETAQRLADYLKNPPARRVTGREVKVNPAYFGKSNLHSTWQRRRP